MARVERLDADVLVIDRSRRIGRRLRMRNMISRVFRRRRVRLYRMTTSMERSEGAGAGGSDCIIELRHDN